jgi:hypothetical protein
MSSGEDDRFEGGWARLGEIDGEECRCRASLPAGSWSLRLRLLRVTPGEALLGGVPEVSGD